MAEESKQAFDPDATVAQPQTDAKPPADPEATLTQPVPLADPEATLTGPLAKAEPDADKTDRRPAFDPDATDRQPAFDPEATVRVPSPGKRRRNPFAPKAPPETIQANLSALGGINPLVALANPVLAAVPQIRRTLKHPDPTGLRAGLRHQLEGLETSAFSAEVSDDAVSAAVYALCALLDESAAATPWGGDWIENGLLRELRGESGGAEGFFVRLDELSADPDKNADLLEFFYICLALGFEGRYRNGGGGRKALDEVKEKLYGLIARRRPRPEGLSGQWRTPSSQSAAEAALATAARANAARAAAQAAAQTTAAATAETPARVSLARLPRRAIWSAVLGVIVASVVLYLLSLRLLEDKTQKAMMTKPNYRASAEGSISASATAPAPASSAAPASTSLASALAGLPVSLSERAGGTTLSLRHAHQFAPGSTLPVPEVQAQLRKIAAALSRVPGQILVIGHADATPSGSKFSTNTELSAARARAVARLMAPALVDPKRLTAEGRGEAEPVAPNDNHANRAKNRRVTILLKPAP